MTRSALALLLALAAARSAAAQCPSCSNPNLALPAPAPVGPAAGRWLVSADAVLLRASSVIEGSGASERTRSLEETTGTVYQHRVLRLGVRHGFSQLWSIEAALPVEEREMLNRSFPPEGAFGIRRHLLLRGIGDAEILGRREWRDLGSRDARLALRLGAGLPTGATLPASIDGPYETVLQIGAGAFRPIAAVEGWARQGRWFTVVRLDLRLGLYENADRFRRGHASSAGLLGGAFLMADRLALALGIDYGSVGPDTRRGATVRNTGGDSLGATAAVQVAVTRGVGASIGARLPVHRRVEGFQLTEDFSASMGLSWTR